MKNSYSFLFMLVCFVAQSQPVLNLSSFTDVSANGYNADVPGFNPGNSGENQLWDFGSIPYDENIAFSTQTVPIATAPFASNFPQANYAYKSSVSFNGFTFEYYSIIKLSASGVESFGLTSTNGVEADYTPDTDFIPFPLTYNLSYTNSYQSTDDVSPTIEQNVYDAYGTIITPFGTFTNVMRLKSTTSEGLLSYDWWTTNPFRVIMSNSGSNITFHDPVPLSTAIFADTTDLNIFPNPANAILNINSTSNQNFDKIVITDMLGKIILEQSQNNTKIDVAGLVKGIYILEAFSGNKKYQHKFMKQ